MLFAWHSLAILAGRVHPQREALGAGSRGSKLTVQAMDPVLQAVLGIGHPKHWQWGPDTLVVKLFLLGNGRTV